MDKKACKGVASKKNITYKIKLGKQSVDKKKSKCIKEKKERTQAITVTTELMKNVFMQSQDQEKKIKKLEVKMDALKIQVQLTQGENEVLKKELVKLRNIRREVKVDLDKTNDRINKS